MAQPTIQTSFASGEWAPKLRSRVDIVKYHAGAALLRNFFVDFSGGGASTRAGTKYINQCAALGSRLIPFQPGSNLSYVLEFGQNYIRFYSNGASILETAVTGGTACSSNQFTIANSFSVGDWVYATGWGGVTAANGQYFIVINASSSAVQVTDLFGNGTNFTGYTSGGQLQRVYTITTPYNIGDLFPNQATDNPGLKFVQDVTSMIICHPNYPPYILTINSATNWTLTQINFGPTISAPTSAAATTTLSAGSWNYSYIVTAVDANGQESPPATPVALTSLEYIGTTPGTNTLTWTGSAGAQSYNVYKALPIFGASIAGGALYGFVGNVTAATFQDAYPGIIPDFGQSIPILQNPFSGASVNNLTLTGNATYTTVPTVVIDPPSEGVQATAIASLSVATDSIQQGHFVFPASPSFSPLNYTISFANGVAITIITAHQIGDVWVIDTYTLTSAGSITGVGAGTPSNPVAPTSNNFPLAVTYGSGFGLNLTWHIGALILVQGGEGYTTTPGVTISGGATATATIGTASGGNPGVPAFFQQRLMLAGQSKAIQSYNLSQPGSFFNFNVSNPSEADDAISGSIISDQLNDIRWARPVPTGIILGTGKTAWLINGGGGLSTAVPITPSNQTAQPQAFNGANDLQPQQINYDMIYGTNKGSYFRDLTYNIYANIYTGTDISVLSNHLFFGYNFLDIAWSEEPFKTMWVIRNDGVMLSLAFVKDQELIGWAHHDTNGQFMSVCSVIETINGNVVDAVYVIAQRVISGTTVQYVERMADRYFPYGYEDSWSVDCGLQTSPAANFNPGAFGQAFIIIGDASAVGNAVEIFFQNGGGFNTYAPGIVIRMGGGIYTVTSIIDDTHLNAIIDRVPTSINKYTGLANTITDSYQAWAPVTMVSGLTQLEGQSVVGVADGAAIGPLTVSNTGTVTLPKAATKVTLGLKYLPQLKTLPLDLGEPTAQSKRKKLPALSLRVADTLGLQVGTSFVNAVTVKDLQIGAIPSGSTGPGQQVTDLVNPSWGDLADPDYQPIDARQILDQLWQEPGQVCIQQNLPYPATILGVMPEVTLGDTPR